MRKCFMTLFILILGCKKYKSQATWDSRWACRDTFLQEIHKTTITTAWWCSLYHDSSSRPKFGINFQYLASVGQNETQLHALTESRLEIKQQLLPLCIWINNSAAARCCRWVWCHQHQSDLSLFLMLYDSSVCDCDRSLFHFMFERHSSRHTDTRYSDLTGWLPDLNESIWLLFSNPRQLWALSADPIIWTFCFIGDFL